MTRTIIKTKYFSSDAADFIIKKISYILATRDYCILGLCGGETPKSVYSEIALKGQLLDWNRIIITFGDERCVSQEHIDSNFRMANESLLSKVSIPASNIYRIRGELGAKIAAREYEEKIFRLKKNDSKILQHDLLLLGIGHDGHTASLFPDTKALSENKRLVVENFVPKLNSERVTFTYRLINASRNICFLVNDTRKEMIVKGVLAGDKSYPATSISAEGNITWIIGE